MERVHALSAAIKAKLILPRSNCVDGAIAYSDDDLQEAIYEFARLVEQETLERAARLAKAYHLNGYDVTGNLELHEAILHKDFQDF